MGLGRKRCHLEMTARTAPWSLRDAGGKQVAHSASRELALEGLIKGLFVKGAGSGPGGGREPQGVVHPGYGGGRASCSGRVHKSLGDKK